MTLKLVQMYMYLLVLSILYVVSSHFMVGALYSVVLPVLWYHGNPVFFREIINVNTGRRTLLFINISEHKKYGEKLVFIHSFYSNDKYFKYLNTMKSGSPIIHSLLNETFH